MVALAVFFPLLGIAANLLLAWRWHREPASERVTAGVIASAAVGVSFVISLLQISALIAHPEPVIVTLAEWIRVGSLTVNWALQVDTLSASMMALVTGVGTLIHLYAIGYMRGDPRFTRFFIYLNLFIAAMLVLVTASSYLLLFVGWEGVGLCSFLLIGFWFDKTGEGEKISSAARKAFLVNRIGDAGLLLGLMLLFVNFGSLDFTAIFSAAPSKFALGAPVVTAITLLLFIGVAGKSAQIPLYIWLPDAMVGPTPVSALIHAATMVTAGVYLVVRSHVLFDLAPLTQAVVAATGAATALLAASVAVTQFDIKRTLAYSTISQLGFMIAAVGIGAYTAGMFHLITHAFFKALLFLAAGSLLHSLGTQDSRAMGGLWSRMWTTALTYVAGALALAGLPPLSGFFSKDEILGAAAEYSPILFLALAAAGFLTAFYIARQIMLIFAGEPRGEGARHAHESPPIMTLPLITLALLAVMGGALNISGIVPLDHWLEHTLGGSSTHGINVGIAALSAVIALAGISAAYGIYRAYRGGDDPLASALFTASNRGWRIDDVYRALFARTFDRFGRWLANADLTFFNGLDQGAAGLAQRTADGVRRIQTGTLNWNIVGFLAGLIAVLVYMLVRRGV